MSKGDWVRLLPVDALETGWVTPATLGNRPFAVFDTPDGVLVTTARCSHAGADLCHGYFTGTAIECPLHQALFDVRTGAPIGAPATRPIRCFETRVQDGYVQIRQP